VVAAVLRHGLGQSRLKDAAVGLDVAAVVLLLTFAIAIMDGIADRLLADPAWVLTVAATAIAVNLALQVAGGLAFAWLDRRRAVTAAFISGNRNMAVVLAVLPAGVHADVFLYFAMAQIPIYVLPALLAPVYRRLVGAGGG
jgi:bile acid:Na+ symporter, BASS family